MVFFILCNVNNNPATANVTQTLENTLGLPGNGRKKKSAEAQESLAFGRGILRTLIRRPPMVHSGKQSCNRSC